MSRYAELGNRISAAILKNEHANGEHSEDQYGTMKYCAACHPECLVDKDGLAIRE